MGGTVTQKVATRDAYGDALAALGKKRDDVVVLDADLSGSTKTSKFAKAFPERFFNIGIAEQDMMGTAAGLAVGGKLPFVSTFAVFATGRAWEQIRQSICYPNLNVKIVASHAGVTVGEDGGSHQSADDIAAGIMTAEALKARELLKAEGIDAGVINMATIKPLDRDAVIAAAMRCGAIVTAEEHSIIGGLGGAVAEVLAESAPVPLVRVGVQDKFGTSGDSEGLLRHYGLSAEDIAKAVKEVIKKKR